jgi:hypothetical protein
MLNPVYTMFLLNWQCHTEGSEWHSGFLKSSAATSAWNMENIPGIWIAAVAGLVMEEWERWSSEFLSQQTFLAQARTPPSRAPRMFLIITCRTRNQNSFLMNINIKN